MKTKKIISLVISGLLGLAFILAGFAKLSGQEEMVVNYEKWGLPIILMYFVGLSEILGAIGLFIKKTRLLAIGGLSILMLGAIGTHVVNGEPFFPPLVLLLLMASLFWVNKN